MSLGESGPKEHKGHKKKQRDQDEAGINHIAAKGRHFNTLLLRNAWVWLHLMRLASRHGAVVTLHPERLRFTDLLFKLQTFAEHLLNPDPFNTPQLPLPPSLVENRTS